MATKIRFKLSFLFLFSSLIAFSSFAQCPNVDGILVNACSASEGIDEMVNFHTGSSALSINSLEMTFGTAGDWCNSGCGANTWGNGTTYFNNSIVNDCTASGVFIRVNNTSGTIPANAQVIVFTSHAPSFNYDLSSLCSSGPYYIVFANNTSSTGRFANNAGTTRSVTLTDQASCSQTVSYIGSGNFTNTDGDYVRYDAAGNPTYMNLSSCIYTPAAFPLAFSFISIGVSQNPSTKNTEINWSVKPTFTTARFEIMKSTDGTTFEQIGFVTPKQATTFKFTDYQADASAYYYITIINTDGTTEKSKILHYTTDSLDQTLEAYSTQGQITIKTNTTIAYTYLVQLLDPLGKEIQTKTLQATTGISETTLSIPTLPSGIYILKAETPFGSQAKRIFID